MFPNQTCWYIIRRMRQSYVVFVQTDTGQLTFVTSYPNLTDAVSAFPHAHYSVTSPRDPAWFRRPVTAN